MGQRPLSKGRFSTDTRFGDGIYNIGQFHKILFPLRGDGGHLISSLNPGCLCSGEPCSTPCLFNTCHIAELALFVYRGMKL